MLCVYCVLWTVHTHAHACACAHTYTPNTFVFVWIVLYFPLAPAPLSQPIANAAQYGNSRIQPIMLERLACMLIQIFQCCVNWSFATDLVPFIQNQRPQTVIRHMLPVLFHFVAAKMPPTGQTRLSLLLLCAALDSCLGSELFEHAHHLPPEQLSKLKELMNSATKPWLDYIFQENNSICFYNKLIRHF